jgi:hypothetical protein
MTRAINRTEILTREWMHDGSADLESMTPVELLAEDANAIPDRLTNLIDALLAGHRRNHNRSRGRCWLAVRAMTALLDPVFLGVVLLAIAYCKRK